jgi:MoaA/NifB/PqqE/SkfB family radical SAM enzyme
MRFVVNTGLEKRTEMLEEQASCRILEFHPGLSCRFSCIFCYRGGKTYPASHEYVTAQRIKKLITEFADLGGVGWYISGGYEPFSSPELALQSILWSSQAGLRVRIYTNGVSTVLAQRHVQTLIACHTAQVRFSVHATDPHTYQRVMRPQVTGANLDIVISNILGILEAKPTTGTPRVGVGTLALDENIHNLIPSADFWRDLGVDFFDVRFDATGSSDNGRIAEAVRKLKSLADTGRFDPLKISIGSFACGEKLPFAPKCYAPLEKLTVDPFGFVWCCCLQSMPPRRPHWALMGDLRSQSYKEILAHVRMCLPFDHCGVCTPWEAHYNLVEAEARKSKDETKASPDRPRTQCIL